MDQSEIIKSNPRHISIMYEVLLLGSVGIVFGPISVDRQNRIVALVDCNYIRKRNPTKYLFIF